MAVSEYQWHNGAIIRNFLAEGEMGALRRRWRLTVPVFWAGGSTQVALRSVDRVAFLARSRSVIRLLFRACP
ncbi:hypothetical protein [Limnothrix redekei]|uniref:Uncharacterized protein n=1 Tax=Limnothrix redekei LRLZ20PSL1 TaxID=3112953 RepID=A0ABW7C9C3_9CYAN